MKWFKHFSEANADDKIVSIRDRFGMWGVGVYWTLVELTAAQMKAPDFKPVARLSVPELCTLFGCKRNKLVSFLFHLRNQTGMNLKHSGNILQIEIPKLLEIKDNSTANLQAACKQVPTKKKIVDIEEEKRKQPPAVGTIPVQSICTFKPNIAILTDDGFKFPRKVAQ